MFFVHIKRLVYAMLYARFFNPTEALTLGISLKSTAGQVGLDVILRSHAA